MRIIPAIDIIDGKCVRLTQGDYSTKIIYNENPLEVAKMFESAGVEYLHLVDLDGAKSRHIVNHKTLHAIATHTSLKIDFGGGIKTDDDIQIAFACGANQITAGSVALNNPQLFINWLALYGSEKIMLGADSRDTKIATDGWLSNSETDVVKYIAGYEQLGIKYVVATDIAKDGMLQGAANELYKKILSITKVKLIASGGVCCMDDLKLLRDMGCDAVIIGKAIYEGKISLTELQALC